MGGGMIDRMQLMAKMLGKESDFENITKDLFC